MISFIHDALISLAGEKLSDHNRSELQVNPEEIENRQRTANGTLRRYYVTTKRTFSLSWTELPSLTAKTVDGFAGADDIEAIYKNNPGQIEMTITYGHSDPETVWVMFRSFSKELTKRGGTGTYDLYNVSLSLEEI